MSEKYEKVRDAWVHYAVKQLKVAVAYDKVVQRCFDRCDLLTDLAELPLELSAPALWFVVGNRIPDC